MADSLPVQEADIVVIGAGAFGLSTAYQLSRMNAGSIIVLDRFEPASQTSPRAAGLYKLIQASAAASSLARMSVDIITSFTKESGIPLEYVASGSILAARTPEHAAIVDTEVAASRSWGVESEKLGTEALRKRAPYLRGKGIRTAYFVPDDIYIEEPIWLLNAYMEAMSHNGARVIGYCPVTRIIVEAGSIAGVETPRGIIRTPLVIDAAGAWARAVSNLAGLDSPIAPVRHQLMITRQIPGLAAQEPIVRVVDASVYLRPARGGLMMGGMERNPLSIDPRPDPDFTVSETPLDMATLDAFTDALGVLTPALGDTPIAEHRGGLFTMTPDGRFLAGPVSGVRGFWTATGCNGSGFSISAGIGQVLAEWIVGGEPPLDMSLFDPNRFGSGPFDDAEMAKAGMWQYANYYTPASAQ